MFPLVLAAASIGEGAGRRSAIPPRSRKCNIPAQLSHRDVLQAGGPGPRSKAKSASCPSPHPSSQPPPDGGWSHLIELCSRSCRWMPGPRVRAARQLQPTRLCHGTELSSRWKAKPDSSRQARTPKLHRRLRRPRSKANVRGCESEPEDSGWSHFFSDLNHPLLPTISENKVSQNLLS